MGACLTDDPGMGWMRGMCIGMGDEDDGEDKTGDAVVETDWLIDWTTFLFTNLISDEMRWGQV